MAVFDQELLRVAEHVCPLFHDFLLRPCLIFLADPGVCRSAVGLQDVDYVHHPAMTIDTNFADSR